MEQKRNAYKKTFKMLKNYRDAKTFAMAEIVAEQREAQESTKRTIEILDAAIEKVKKRREQSGRAYEYAAFDLYFLQANTYEQIAEKLNTGKNTPRRWVTGIINDLSILLWGYAE